MIHLKTQAELQIMLEGGRRLREVVKELKPKIKAGITTNEVNRMAEEFIKKQGAESSFNKVHGYSWSTCLPINEQVVHTPPSKRVIKDQDVFTLDIGLYFKGFHVDYADTFAIGKVKDKETERFLQVGKQTLNDAIKVAKNGKRIADISAVIEKAMDKNGYFVMRELTGHGIGKELHEEPYVPGYVPSNPQKSYKIGPGLAIAIEVIYSMGTEEIKQERGQDWSIVSRDGSLTACFEHTIVCLEDRSVVAT